MQRPAKDRLFVTVQLILFIMYFLVPPIVRWHLPGGWNLLTLIPAASGIVICITSVLQLKRNLTPFPSPVPGGQLITSGMFKWARHPIYSGLILFFTAFAVYQGSLGKVLVALLLLVLFYVKSRYEEHLLEKSYLLYLQYKRRTGRFFPKFRKRTIK